MKPIDALTADEAKSLAGLVFDLDDTLLDGSALSEAAYASLFRLRESGLLLFACTGRPGGWIDAIACMWPLDGAIAENGGVIVIAEKGSHPRRLRYLAKGDASPNGRARLLALAESLVATTPSAAIADDNAARFSDVTIDIGEHRRVAAVDVARMRAIAREAGVRTTASSVHLHLTTSGHDKASATVALAEAFGIDATAALSRLAFIGDSGNDAAAFGAFRITFAVANVARHLASITRAPRYVAHETSGAGFVAVAKRLAALRVG